jgi:type II secretory pathway pseudopilin PulG
MKNWIKIAKIIHNQKGVGLVEILVSAFLIAILCAVVLNAFLGDKQAANIQAQVSEAQQSATFSLTELTVAVRNAGYGVPTGTPPYRKRIGTLGHDTLIIYCKNNGGTIDSTRYFLDHTTDAVHPTLKRKKNTAAAEVFAENIEDIDFFEVPLPPAQVKSITVSITARTEDIDKHLNDYRRRTVSSNIQMANAAL